jgi:hypothetical protein
MNIIPAGPGWEVVVVLVGASSMEVRITPVVAWQIPDDSATCYPITPFSGDRELSDGSWLRFPSGHLRSLDKQQSTPSTYPSLSDLIKALGVGARG